MFGIDDAILGAGLSFGGKLLSGLGAGQSASKANKRAANLQAFADAQNQVLQANKNAADADLGKSLIARADSVPSVDTSAWMAAGQAAGFNPVTWLNAGTLSLFDNRAMQQAFISQGTAMQSPGVTNYGVANQQAVPSVMSAIGGAITAGADSYSTSVQAAAKNSTAQQGIAAVLAAIQKSRAGGNQLAGLGTPAFSMAGALTSGGGAAAALSLGKKAGDALNIYGLKDKAGEVMQTPGFLSNDPSISSAENIVAREGWWMGNLMSLGLPLADGYWTATGRSVRSDFPADWSLLRQDLGFSSSSSSIRNADRLQAAEAAQPGIVDRNIRNATESTWWSWPYSVNRTGYSSADPWAIDVGVK